MTDAPDLVLCGNLLVDDIVLADGSALLGEPGGAVLHTALAASLWGCRVGIMAVAGSDYPRSALDELARRGVDLAGVRHLDRPGGRAWLLHEPTARRVIHHLDCPSHAEVSPVVADLPASWRSARGIHLAPMPLERQTELAHGLATVASTSFVSLDPFELIRDDTLAHWRTILGRIDALFAGADDLRLSGDPATALRGIAGERLRFLVLKQAEHGGSLLDLHGTSTHRWAPRVRGVVDVTGAGDAFAGGFLAGWLQSGDLDVGMAQGVVSAGFAVEDWGSRGLAGSSRQQAQDRLAEWFPHLATGVPAKQETS
jgi:sugar/nucleoside kinase (ribokinase family)